MPPIPFSAFLPLIGQGVNAVSNLLTNQSQKNLSLQMYDKQRADALADWNRQNQYNSPAAQMQRFKEAGLSPHLIYGQTNTAPAVRSSDAKMPNYTAPQFDPQSINPLLTAIQLENAKKQGGLIDAQTLKTNAETNWKNLNTNFLEQTIPYRSEVLFQQGQLLGSKNRNEQERYSQIRQQTDNLKKQANNIVANTNLAETKKAELNQMIQNLITTNALLGERVKTEQYQNQIQQKIQSFGVAGSTLAALLRLLK